MGWPVPQQVINDICPFIPASAIKRRLDLDHGTSLLQVEMSPDLALDLLTSRNTHNRRIRSSSISRYSSDMQTGHWVDGLVDPIHFSTDGDALNGQHRLRSIVESGRTVTVFVQVRCPREWQIALDCGLLRSQADVEKITYGKDIDHAFVAVARSMKVGLTDGNQSNVFTRHEMHEFIERHAPAIQFATGLFPSHVVAVTTAPVKAVLARASYSRPQEVLREFAHSLVTGEIHAPYQSVCTLLRSFMTTRGTGGGNIMREHYGKTERALIAFCERRPLQKLYAADAELFPLPGERSL